MGKKVFQRLNVRHCDVHHITGLPPDQIRRSDAVDGIEQMHPHLCQNAISTQMGKHTLQIAADRDQDRANCRQGRINSGSVTKSRRSQKPQGSKAHQSHMGQGSKGTGQRGDANIFPDWASHHQKAVIHLFHRITEFSLHSATSIACWRTTSSL